MRIQNISLVILFLTFVSFSNNIYANVDSFSLNKISLEMNCGESDTVVISCNGIGNFTVTPSDESIITVLDGTSKLSGEPIVITNEKELIVKANKVGTTQIIIALGYDELSSDTITIPKVVYKRIDVRVTDDFVSDKNLPKTNKYIKICFLIIGILIIFFFKYKFHH